MQKNNENVKVAKFEEWEFGINKDAILKQQQSDVDNVIIVGAGDGSPLIWPSCDKSGRWNPQVLIWLDVVDVVGDGTFWSAPHVVFIEPPIA